VSHFTTRSFYSPVKFWWCALNRRLGGSRSLRERFGEEKNPLSLPGFEPRPTLSLVSVPTTRSGCCNCLHSCLNLPNAYGRRFVSDLCHVGLLIDVRVQFFSLMHSNTDRDDRCRAINHYRPRSIHHQVDISDNKSVICENTTEREERKWDNCFMLRCSD
jgi:hypothetical protein